MAKYSDYVKDDISDEIVDAVDQSQVRREEAPAGFRMPERFVGKSPEEIAQAYVESETLRGRQVNELSNELGTMRKNVADMTDLQSQLSRPPEVEDTPVTVDDIYEDAEKAISRVVNKSASGRIEALETELRESRTMTKVSELNSDYPGWQETAQTPEFLNWVAESSYRTRLAKAADAYDFDAADTLFGIYGDLKGTTQSKADAELRSQQLKDATLESSTASSPETAETFSLENLTNARIAAKKGNPSARKWLSTNGDAIRKAYEEGHITD
jgi:hypothetical protein